jgi:hypothetical protein
MYIVAKHVREECIITNIAHTITDLKAKLASIIQGTILIRKMESTQ